MTNILTASEYKNDSPKKLRSSDIQLARLNKLSLLKRISNLKIKPSFELQPEFNLNGEVFKAVVYKPDFMFFDNELQRTIILDSVKRPKTAWEMKRKLYIHKNLHIIHEVYK